MKLTRGLIVSEYDQRDTEALGDNSNQYNMYDIGKAVKYSDATMALCADGDEIVGFVEAMEAYTDGGRSVGTVKKTGRFRAEVSGVALSVGDLVVAGPQPALGTQAAGTVKTGAPATYKWAVVWLDDDGTAGTTVVVERV